MATVPLTRKIKNNKSAHNILGEGLRGMLKMVIVDGS